MLRVRPARRDALAAAARAVDAVYHDDGVRLRHLPARVVVHVQSAAGQHRERAVLLQAEQEPILLAGVREPAGHEVAVLRDVRGDVLGEAGHAVELAAASEDGGAMRA